MEELKPCPFCGGEADFDMIFFIGCAITCSECDAAMIFNYIDDWDDESKAEAAEIWNRRADECDRDALLALADECGDASRSYAGDGRELTSRQFANVARRIRKALGVE